MILEKVLWCGERENVKMLSLHGDKTRYLYFRNGDYELFKRLNCVKQVKKQDEI